MWFLVLERFFYPAYKPPGYNLTQNHLRSCMSSCSYYRKWSAASKGTKSRFFKKFYNFEYGPCRLKPTEKRLRPSENVIIWANKRTKNSYLPKIVVHYRENVAIKLAYTDVSLPYSQDFGQHFFRLVNNKYVIHCLYFWHV